MNNQTISTSNPDEQHYTVYRRVRVTNTITKGVYFGVIAEEEVRIKHSNGGWWVQTHHLPMNKLQEIVFSEEFLADAPNLKRSIERFGKENFSIMSYETDTYGSEDEANEALARLVERYMDHYTTPCYNDEFMTEEDEIDWEALKENARRLRAEEEAKRKKLPNHRPTEGITIEDLNTGEKKTFENKTDCMNFLQTSSATFSKFLKGLSKLNKLFKVTKS